VTKRLARRFPRMRGHTRPNLFRMRQFFEAYRGNKKVSALLRQLPWTHHLLILSQAKPRETREFYILAAIRERWSSRELERQIQSAAILRSHATAKNVSPAVAQLHPTAILELKNAYSLEFLSLQDHHSEADLHGALLRSLGRFITELGTGTRICMPRSALSDRVSNISVGSPRRVLCPPCHPLPARVAMECGGAARWAAHVKIWPSWCSAVQGGDLTRGDGGAARWAAHVKIWPSWCSAVQGGDLTRGDGGTARWAAHVKIWPSWCSAVQGAM